MALKEKYPHIEKLDLQTDGASNYGSTGLLLSMRDMAKRVAAAAGTPFTIGDHLLTEAGGGATLFPLILI